MGIWNYEYHGPIFPNHASICPATGIEPAPSYLSRLLVRRAIEIVSLEQLSVTLSVDGRRGAIGTQINI